MQCTGAEMLLKSLEAEGVETIFGIPGGAVLALYDALYHSDIKHILTRHEQGAIFAADGYARSTGKPGVVFATSGPGATNLVTGIANAYMDSVPLVAITGQVASAAIGKDSFQEADIIGITMPITKHSFLVKDISKLAETVKKAFHIATTGRPGPVLIDVPKDVLAEKHEFIYPETISIKSYKYFQEGNKNQIKQAASLIKKAAKPVIYYGGGVVSADANKELVELAEKTGIPVTSTLMGLGAFPGTHPLFMGMLGMHGTKPANFAVCECDLLIAIGARFDDRVTSRVDSFATNAKVIHIDIDPAEIGKNVKIDVPIVGDVKIVLKELNKLVTKADIEGWVDKIYQWRKENPLTYDDSTLKPQQVIEKVFEVTRGEAIITTEVGQHQMWTALFYKFVNNRSLLTSGGLGSMGYGLPAAMGAQVGKPNQTVVNISGDGSIQMNSQEFATIVDNNLPVITVIINNGYLGMVRQWQDIFFDKRYSHSSFEDQGLDFVKLAEAYGAKGKRVTKAEEVGPALEEAIKARVPFVLDCIVEEEENVFPMVAPGQPITNMLLGR
ncbi:acetolactate synthase-1/2/3 large subunit [Desulfitispora alkaliphila]|uniref:biosynthetic-type acetolactate synthase large subunit n=1 Tax=Desulfitispora alkaliphila TaxID=622674 RepID=UPI003D1E170A